MKYYVRLTAFLVLCLVLINVFPAAATEITEVSNAKKATDYEKHIDIWGEDVPGNCSDNKLSRMNIDMGAQSTVAAEFSEAIAAEDIVEAERVIDTMTYFSEIKPGYESDKFDDRPYLIPYPADGRSVSLSKIPSKVEYFDNGHKRRIISINNISRNNVSTNNVSTNNVSTNSVSGDIVSDNKSVSVDESGTSAVIILSGGAYAYKSMDGSDFESKDIALALNKAGISAFVLHYRSNPYEYPYPWLDLQRAVRHLRFYAEDYGIDPDSISLIGCSAGANLAGVYTNMRGWRRSFPENCLRDEIDLVSDEIATLALIYPVTTFEYNSSMLFALFPADLVRDEYEREKLMWKVDFSNNFRSPEVPQFVCYGTEDRLVDCTGTEDYVYEAEDMGIDVEEYPLEGADHSFRSENYIEGYINWLNRKLN